MNQIHLNPAVREDPQSVFSLFKKRLTIFVHGVSHATDQGRVGPLHEVEVGEMQDNYHPGHPLGEAFHQARLPAPGCQAACARAHKQNRAFTKWTVSGECLATCFGSGFVFCTGIRNLDFFPIRIRATKNKFFQSKQKQNFGGNFCCQPKK